MESTSFRTQATQWLTILTGILSGLLTAVGFFVHFVVNHYAIGVDGALYLITGVVLFLTRVTFDPSLNDSGRVLKLLWIFLSIWIHTQIGWKIATVLTGIATLIPVSTLIDERDVFSTLTLQPISVGLLGGTKFQADFLLSKGNGYVDICSTFPFQKVATLDKFNLPRCRRTIPGDILGYAYLEADAKDGSRLKIRLPLPYVRRLTNIGGELIHYLRKPITV